jgi:hypothetical protein
MLWLGCIALLAAGWVDLVAPQIGCGGWLVIGTPALFAPVSSLVVGPLALSMRANEERPESSPHVDSCLVPKGASPLDDEVEQPDESEDDEPDDLGSAINPDGRPIPHSLVPCMTELCPPVEGFRAPLFELTGAKWERLRFLSLCRFLC